MNEINTMFLAYHLFFLKMNSYWSLSPVFRRLNVKFFFKLYAEIFWVAKTNMVSYFRNIQLAFSQ